MNGYILSLTLCASIALGPVGPAVCDGNGQLSPSTLEEYMNRIRDPGLPATTAEITDRQILNSHPAEVLALLEPYETDVDRRIRHAAYDLVWRTGKLHSNPAINEVVILKLIPIGEPDAGLASLWNRRVMSFSKDDFTPKLEQIIRRSIEDHPTSLTILLAGVAGIAGELESLRELANDPGGGRGEHVNHSSLPWAARCARARCGAIDEIQRCLEYVDSQISHGVGAAEPSTLLLPYIGYIRQPQTILFLKRFLDTDERMVPVKSTASGERYCQVAAYVLADCLEGFPVERREGRGYSQEEIERCREWMAEQDEWKIIR